MCTYALTALTLAVAGLKVWLPGYPNTTTQVLCYLLITLASGIVSLVTIGDHGNILAYS